MTDDKQRGQVTPLSLLQRARANDQQAWSRLTALYRPLVQFWCRQAHCPAAEVEDIAQEVFAGVAAGLGSFHHDRAGDTFRGGLRVMPRSQPRKVSPARSRWKLPRPAATAAKTSWAMSSTSAAGQ